ncbi:MAG: cation:proton antiporter [Limosilactobacillus sp.]|uniref:monovalent cation:proton antiporter family protein n=1 Tax=Limosilactobacillus sp. TaxID=2773925 RepID=UPI00270DDA7D|nr:cation:proton antiporter [Limosilactobacillus sp.]
MEQASILIVVVAALIIPIVMARFKVSTIPTAVAEIIAGIILGKSAFNIVIPNQTLTMMSTFGVIMLMFLSGMEIDFDLFRGHKGQKQDGKSPVKLAVQAFAVVIVCSVLMGTLLKVLGLFSDIFLATIVFSTVALGVVIATLKEKEILGRPAGQTILLTAVLGEVIPMLSLTIYASINGGNAGRLWLITLLFVAAIVLLHRFRQPYVWFNRISKATTQLDIRLAFCLIFVLVTIAETVGAENILGAFLAGMVMKLLQPTEATKDKLTSIGYGFLIPFFFILTGVKLNLKTLLSNPQSLALIPVLVFCFILAKLPIMAIFHRRFSMRNSFAGSFLIVTTITLVLPSLAVARELHAITSSQSDDFTLAAVIVCLISPIIFNTFYKLEKADLIKQRVVFIGTNTFSVPVSQQLSKNWYEVRMVTDKEDNYKTFNSEVADLTYMPTIDEESMRAGNFFDTDILIVFYQSDTKNARIAKIAKANGVPRVIASQSNPAGNHKKFGDLYEQGIEVYNHFNVHTSVLRALIETPSVLDMLMDTEAGLFESVVRNPNLVGMELHNLPFIDSITVSRIYRNHKAISPHGDTVLEEGDHILFTGERTAAEEARRQLRRRR